MPFARAFELLVGNFVVNFVEATCGVVHAKHTLKTYFEADCEEGETFACLTASLAQDAEQICFDDEDLEISRWLMLRHGFNGGAFPSLGRREQATQHLVHFC